MHQLTRFFSPSHNHHSKKAAAAAAAEENEGIDIDPKSKPKMSSSGRSKPKLERRNAHKNINYEAASSSLPSSATATTAASSSSPFSVDQPSLLTSRSLDIPSNTSFRIGGLDGEIDRICIALGLSGPEDFAIPNGAWEARKAKSSSQLLPKPLLHQLDNNNTTCTTAAAVAVAVAVAAALDGDDSRFGARVYRNSPNDGSSSSSTTSGDGGGGGGGGGGAKARGRGGINGVRPPVLAPPPSMSVPVLDHSGSTWDLVRDFAPKNNTNCISSSSRGSRRKDHRQSSSSDEENGDGVLSDEEEEEEEEDEIGDGIVDREDVDEGRLGETAVNSDFHAFSSSNDDDCSSTTTEQNIISPDVKFTRNIRSWTKGSVLGSGSFGTVYEALTDEGDFIAVKEVSLLDQGGLGKQSIDQLDQEIALLSQFEHENIVRYLGTHKDEAKLYIFLELVTKGSLAQLYQNYHLKDSQVSAYTRQILHGLKYLHDRNIVHRDIKCANILVHTDGSVKLADFGLAKTTKLNDVKSCKGTAFWMAPEVVKGKNQGYGLAADIWSLGCTVLEMLTRRLPYHPLEGVQAVYRIGRGELPSIPGTLSGDAQDFIRQCLQSKPDNRPTAAKLLEHAFVRRPVSASGSESPWHNNWRQS